MHQCIKMICLLTTRLWLIFRVEPIVLSLNSLEKILVNYLQPCGSRYFGTLAILCFNDSVLIFLSSQYETQRSLFLDNLQILDWLSHSPSNIESYIRPGCIILTIYLRMDKSTWEKVTFLFPEMYHSFSQRKNGARNIWVCCLKRKGKGRENMLARVDNIFG